MSDASAVDFGSRAPFGGGGQRKSVCSFLRQQTEQKAIKTVNKRAVSSVLMASQTMDV